MALERYYRHSFFAKDRMTRLRHVQITLHPLIPEMFEISTHNNCIIVTQVSVVYVAYL